MNLIQRRPGGGRAADLLTLLGERDSAYAYDLATVSAQSAVLRNMRSVSRILYALKANPHPDILRTVTPRAADSNACHALKSSVCWSPCPDPRDAVLFTPNFAPRGVSGRWSADSR
jgi:diaminopimelate decarboxylase/aspartate kinase